MHPYLELHWCMYAHVYTCMLACIQTFGWGPVASIDVTPNFGLEPSEALFDTRHSTVMLQQACCHCHLWSDIIEHYTYMYMSIIYIYSIYIPIFFPFAIGMWVDCTVVEATSDQEEVSKARIYTDTCTTTHTSTLSLRKGRRSIFAQLGCLTGFAWFC